ncbi:MAG TPA: proline--tRNA ligase [Dehalococcoidia bacterium]|nr:proline--tRNA ligase [Dehalococcoidia bacterium]
MRMSRMFGHTLRETPAEAETPSHYLLLRAGFIDQLMAGVYSYMPLGNRTKRRVEEIVREEMDAAGAQETQLPAIHPLELWEQSGRDRSMADVLFPLTDRRERKLVLGPTHEEVMTKLFRDHARSYRDLPATLYQIQTKFRDEVRPRAGLQRLREFTMKDAYSFDMDEQGLDASYGAMFDAYKRIFERCGVPIVAVEADSGAIGGKGSQEFVFVTPSGEDTIVLCDQCDYAANTEKAEFVRPVGDVALGAADALPIEDVATPDTITIEDLVKFLDITPQQTAKAVFYMARELGAHGAGEPVFVVVRGDLQVNEVKVSNALGGRELTPMTDAEAQAVGIVPGYASPIGIADRVRVIADSSIAETPNLVAGANREGVHLRNVNYGRDWEAEAVADIALAEEGHACVRCDGGTLAMDRAIEMGHVFRLGLTYSEPLKVEVLDADGERQMPTMGCYGIGIDRIVAAAVEANHDDEGIKWPAEIAPYDVHMVGLGLDRDEDLAADADALYEELTAAGLSVLFDDRDESPGVKFNDADLIGLPVRVTVSARNHKAGVVEMQRRGGEAEQPERSASVERVLALRAGV